MSFLISSKLGIAFRHETGWLKKQKRQTLDPLSGCHSGVFPQHANVNDDISQIEAEQPPKLPKL